MTTLGACDQRTVLCLLAAAKEPMTVPVIAEFGAIDAPKAVRDILAACAETISGDGGAPDVEAFGFRGSDVRDRFVTMNEAGVAAAAKNLAQKCREWRSLRHPLSRRYALQYAGDHLSETQDLDALWDICRDDVFRREQIDASNDYAWTVRLLTSLGDAYGRLDGHKHYERLAWTVSRLGQTVQDGQSDIVRATDCLHNGSPDSLSRVESALRLMKGGNGRSLLLRSAHLLYQESDVQLHRADKQPNPAGLSLILNRVCEWIPKPEEHQFHDRGVEHVSFLAPLVARLAALAPHQDVVAWLARCHADSLSKICSLICAGAEKASAPLPQLLLAMAATTEIRSTWEFGDPAQDICDAAVKAGVLKDVLSVSDGYHEDVAARFRCKAALAAFRHMGSDHNPLSLLRDVEDLALRDQTLETLARWMAEGKDPRGALDALSYIVSPDVCDVALTWAARACERDAEREAVLTLTRRLRRAEQVAKVLAEAAVPVGASDKVAASNLLQEALDRAHSVKSPDSRWQALASIADTQHHLGFSAEARATLAEAVDACRRIKDTSTRETAFIDLAETLAETGNPHLILELAPHLAASASSADRLVRGLAPIYAERGWIDDFAELVDVSLRDKTLIPDCDLHGGCAEALQSFPAGAPRDKVRSVLVMHADRGNLVAILGLALAAGHEGNIAEGIALLRRLDMRSPAGGGWWSRHAKIKPSAFKATVKAFGKALTNRHASQTAGELLAGVNSDVDDDRLFENADSSANEQAQVALPEATLRVALSLMDSAGAHQRRDLIDDLTTVAMTAAKASPATALSRSADIARTEAIERIAKTLAKIGYIREGCAAAAEIPIEGVRAVCNKEIADGLLQEGKATEARAIIATIEKSALRFSGVISIAKDLARRGDVGAGLSELNVVEDPGLRVNGVQGIANTLAAGSADDKAYRRVLEELASACAQADRMIPVEDWFFDTMSQAMAEAGKTEDILRLVDRIPPESERADDFKNAVLIDAADTLIDHGHTDGLDRLIAALGDPESRDHRRRRWAVHVAEHQGYQDAEGIMATITDSSIRTRAKSEMVMGFLSEDRPADAVHVAEIIGPDESSGYGGDRDDAFNNIVTYYVTKGDVAAATRAAEQVHRPWYRAWSLARLGKAHVACGHVERGQDLFRQSICLAQRIRDQWQQENLIKFCCREYGKWADVDFLASALRKMRDIGHMTDAAIAVAMFCHRHQKPDMALTILGETAQRTQGRRTKGAAFDALRGVIRAYAAIGADATARELIRSLGNGGKQKTLVQLLEESHQPVGDAPALPDPMTMDAWSSIIKAVEQVGAGGERIAACRRILDEPSVRTSKAFRDHVAQIAVRAFRGLTPDEKREERIGLITTLVECGCRNLAAKIFRQIRDREEDFLFGKFIAVLAEGVRDSDAPFEWVAFAGTLDIQPSVRKAEVLQSAAFQLGQRRKGDPAAAVEMIRNLDEVPLPPDALATAYASSHMALAKCGSRDLRHLTGSMLRTARNPRLARSSVLCMMTILVRSGEYAEAKRLADMCPELGLMGVFSG